jgi:hypothetical protein
VSARSLICTIADSIAPFDDINRNVIGVNAMMATWTEFSKRQELTDEENTMYPFVSGRHFL